MSADSSSLNLTIQGRTFRVAAPAAQAERLHRAAERVQALCERIARQSPRTELERVLLLAALELAAETSVPRPEDNATAPLSAPPPGERELVERIEALQMQVAQALLQTRA
ncbi:MAG: cell division protein ZapA [Casimicrobiaceae bacterium]|nr:cell division protein ZapA [Casimicrobiaceae bacterium]